MHESAVSVIVIDRVVLRAAIVPERERAHAPAEAAGELGPDLMLEQIAEQWRALLLVHVLEPHRVRDVHIQRPASGLRMRAHYRMLREILIRQTVARLGLSL